MVDSIKKTRLEFEGKIVCIHHIHKDVGGTFHVNLDPHHRYSVLDIKVGRDEVTIIRPMNSRKLREWQGKPNKEIKSGDRVRVVLETLYPQSPRKG